MTLTAASDPARIVDLRMARVHLRMGQLMLARAELEDLFRRDALDVVGLAVLAEARWRTGDGAGAADLARLAGLLFRDDALRLAVVAPARSLRGLDRHLRLAA